MFVRSRDLVVAAVVAVALGTALSTGLDNGVLRVVFGLALLLFLPGYVWSEALFPAGGVRGAERLAVIFGVSMALAVVGGLLLNYSAAGMGTASWATLTTGVVLLGALVALLRRERELPMPALIKSTPRLSRHEALLFAAALLLAALAVGIGTGAATQQDSTDFTQLWLLQRGGSRVEVGVGNLEADAAAYRLEVRLGGALIDQRSPVELQPGEHWQTTVDLPANQGSRAVEALLFRLDNPARPYRRTEIWLTPAARR